MAEVKGGDALKAKMKELSRNIKKASKLRVGYLESARYPNGTPVGLVAAVQDGGAPTRGIPPRPFFRNMVKNGEDEWGKTVEGLLKANNYDAELTLKQLGLIIEGELKQSVVDTYEPPLSPVTLMLRKMRKENPSLVVTAKTVGEAARRVKAGEGYGGVSTKPLVDQHNMLLNAMASDVT